MRVCVPHIYTRADMTTSVCHDISCVQSYHLKEFLIKAINFGKASDRRKLEHHVEFTWTKVPLARTCLTGQHLYIQVGQSTNLNVHKEMPDGVRTVTLERNVSKTLQPK